MKKRVLIMVSLSAVWILLASLEVFAAVGNPEAYLGQAASAEHYQLFRELVLVQFLRQIYLPVIMALSALIVWPRFGFNRLYKAVFGLFLFVRMIWLFTGSLGFVTFKYLYLAVMLACFFFLLSKDGKKKEQEGFDGTFLIR